MRDIQEKFDYFQKLNDSKIQNLFYQAKEGYVFPLLSCLLAETKLGKLLKKAHMTSRSQQVCENTEFELVGILT